MREKRIGVLQESDHDEPVVNPEVRDKVVAEHVVPALQLHPVVHGSEPEGNADIRDDDLEKLGGLEEGARKGVEVVVALRVPLLTTRVERNIKRPTEYKLRSAPERSRKW